MFICKFGGDWACFHYLPCVNAASASCAATADAAGLAAQLLLPCCFPTPGPLGGYAQVKGESKDPGRGKTGTSNVTGQLSPSLQTFSLSAALQTHCQPPGEAGEMKGMAGSLWSTDRAPKWALTFLRSSAEWVAHNRWFMAPFHLSPCLWYVCGDWPECNTWDLDISIRDLPRSCDPSQHPRCVWFCSCSGELPNYLKIHTCLNSF